MYEAEDDLPRRGWLGLELRGSTLEVRNVVIGSTSDDAGIMPGDKIVSIDGEGATEVPHLAELARKLRPGAPVAFLVDRGGVPTVLESTVMAAPIETVVGADVKLGHVQPIEGGGHRLRTIATVPRGRSGPFTAVLWLSGLGTSTCELSADREDPRRRLIEAFTRLGLVTLRVERSGTGDSEGPPASTVDLFSEIAGYRAALEQLRMEDAIRDSILFGESVGGRIAPFLTGPTSGVSAIAVFGASARRWSETIVEGTRRERLLGGVPDDEDLATYVAAWADLQSRVLGGLTPEEVFELSPSLRAFEGPSCNGRTMFGRDVEYFQQLERLDLPALWRTTKVPVLLLSGSHDWVCGPEEAEHIATFVRHARVVELEGLGHDMLRHATRLRSFNAPYEGWWDDSIATAFGVWFERVKL